MRNGDATAITQLERELKVGPYEHPYGFDREGLITECRVEAEERYRTTGWGGMPTLLQREADAEEEAQRRWPYMFVEDATL